MEETSMMQLILNELKSMREEIVDLKAGQKRLEIRIDDGLKEVRRDITRLDRKIDTLSLDVGNALANVTDNVGDEIERLKRAK